MLILIYGGSAGGKSEYAGRLAEKLANGSVIRYLATMVESGAEALEKIRRHDELRKNGNYEVRLCLSFPDLEQFASDLNLKNPEIRPDETQPVVLFDSLDGFLADVMFALGSDSESGTGSVSEDEMEAPPDGRTEADGSESGSYKPAESRTEGSTCGQPESGNDEPAESRLDHLLRRLEARAGHVILVTDDFYRDGTVYDPQTEGYIEAAGRMLRSISRRADAVIEVIFGIPLSVCLKRGGTTLWTKETWYEFLEIPYHHDINLYADSGSSDGMEAGVPETGTVFSARSGASDWNC